MARREWVTLSRDHRGQHITPRSRSPRAAHVPCTVHPTTTTRATRPGAAEPITANQITFSIRSVCSPGPTHRASSADRLGRSADPDAASAGATAALVARRERVPHRAITADHTSRRATDQPGQHLRPQRLALRDGGAAAAVLVALLFTRSLSAAQGTAASTRGRGDARGRRRDIVAAAQVACRTLASADHRTFSMPTGNFRRPYSPASAQPTPSPPADRPALVRSRRRSGRG